MSHTQIPYYAPVHDHGHLIGYKAHCPLCRYESESILPASAAAALVRQHCTSGKHRMNMLRRGDAPRRAA